MPGTYPYRILARIRILTKTPEGEPSAKIRARVLQAIAFRRKRGQHQPNAQLRTKELKTICELAPPALALLKSAMQELNLSARSYTKILKISRTIADLAEGEGNPIRTYC